MAPANTPSRKKRENQYFDVGVQGRYGYQNAERTIAMLMVL
jgi:hypothetical protein